jgi:hypothetical protein
LRGTHVLVIVMSLPAETASIPTARRNFILQQGLCEPAAGTCGVLYSALLFQPWVVGAWVVLGTILQMPGVFLILGMVLWWCAAAARFNPFDALHNMILGRVRGISLTAAPAPRRFAQFVAGTFALAIGLSLWMGWRVAAYVLEGFFLAAIAALLLGGFCLGSFVYHLVCGRRDFATRTLPWAKA